MDFDPQKLFIGLIDFFSVLMPGAVLTFLVKDDVGKAVLGAEYEAITGATGWAAFLFGSYLLGHLVFLASSWLDEPYDWLRSRALGAQILQVAQCGKLVNAPTRFLARLVFKRELNIAVSRATTLRRQSLRRLGAENAVNTFQWSKALLAVQAPSNLATVQRSEADSKFFRSFAVVLTLLLGSWPFQERWPASGAAPVAVLLVLTLWRYAEQRFKATNQAYWAVLTLLGQREDIFHPTPPSPGDDKHAGGVVVRTRAGRAQVLLVQSTCNPTTWVLPKGRVEPGEDERSAAIREVQEETGVWARPTGSEHLVEYSVGGNPVAVRYFAMEPIGRGFRLDRARRHRWTPTQEAEKTLPREAVEAVQKLRTDRRTPAASD